MARKKKKTQVADPGSRGLTPAQVAPPADAGSGQAVPVAVTTLVEQVEADGGRALARFRDPIGGNWQILVVLPIDKVVPTPFQRDLSPTHVGRLASVIDRLDRFVDPVIAVRTRDGAYWTPNGHHRVAAMLSLGARSVTVLLLADVSVAYQILALNTEKAHNVREKSLEVIRMARSLATLDPDQLESSYALEFEEPSLLTLGACYEGRGRFSGSSYQAVLRRIDAFVPKPLSEALVERAARAEKVLDLDDQVIAAVATLKERGFDSPYLKAFVVARVNPLRSSRGAAGQAGFDETVATMIEKAKKLDLDAIAPEQVSGAAGPAED